jgi:hypothetical protein
MMMSVARRDTPRVLPGSLITLRRRCGKPACHCASGDPHETPALSYSLNGRSKMLTLRPDEVKVVSQAVARYRKAVGELEAEAYEELRWLLEGLNARREGSR